MTERDRVRFGTTSIAYEVRRSARREKTVEVTVDGGCVRVAAPSAMAADEVRAVVRKRAAWILSHSTNETRAAVPKRFVSGETLPYLGRNVRIVVERADIPAPDVRFDHWRFRIRVPHDAADDVRTESTRRAVVEWYKERAVRRLPERVMYWWPRLGEGTTPAVLIRDQRRRWASCAPDGTLRFNWRVVMAAPALIDYVVVHELVHLTVMDHSSRFWAKVGHVMPDYKQRRSHLTELGRTVEL